MMPQPTSTTPWPRENITSVAGLRDRIGRAPGDEQDTGSTLNVGEPRAKVLLGQHNDHIALLKALASVNIHCQVLGFKSKAWRETFEIVIQNKSVHPPPQVLPEAICHSNGKMMYFNNRNSPK